MNMWLSMALKFILGFLKSTMAKEIAKTVVIEVGKDLVKDSKNTLDDKIMAEVEKKLNTIPTPDPTEDPMDYE